jgi:hypothetical protein
MYRYYTISDCIPRLLWARLGQLFRLSMRHLAHSILSFQIEVEDALQGALEK